jgi:hypothetical protein
MKNTREVLVDAARINATVLLEQMRGQSPMLQKAS